MDWWHFMLIVRELKNLIGYFFYFIISIPCFALLFYIFCFVLFCFNFFALSVSKRTWLISKLKQHHHHYYYYYYLKRELSRDSYNRNDCCNADEITTSFYYYIYYHFIHSGFSTPALADSFSLESEWQQVSSSLLSILAHLKKGCSLDGLGSPSDFQLFQPPYPAFWDPSKCINYNWYHRHLHVQ